MASSMRSHRAIAVGISGGFGLALPFFAYLATLPFGDTSNAVRADAVPFAAGALAGVGLMALSSYLIDASAAEDDAAEQGSAKPEAASRTPARAARASETSVLKGVPIITRAVDALDEEEAWAEIDAMFAEDSPISCDPVHSKDMYQIAFEELQRAEHERAAAAASHRAASPQATATQGTSAQPQPVRTAAHVTAAETGRLGVSAPATASTAVPAAASTAVPAAASTAAFTALVETASAVPSAAAASNETESRAAARDRAAAMASLGASAVAGPAAAPSALGASVAAPPASPVPAAAAPQAVEEVVYTVPVADYSGHEAMWEAAVAILEELDAPSASAAAPAAPSPAVTAQMDARRMAELAEDGCIERDHRRVDEILEEEFDRVGSKSVRNTTHEYLRVIQGGTAAMPRLKAEA